MKKSYVDFLNVILMGMLIFTLSHIPNARISSYDFWDHLLRKSAHITEYAILATLFIRYISNFYKKSNIVLLITTALCVAYAASDEFHQSFVPGRGPSIKDVFVDSVGVILAIYYEKYGKKFKYNHRK